MLSPIHTTRENPPDAQRGVAPYRVSKPGGLLPVLRAGQRHKSIPEYLHDGVSSNNGGSNIYEDLRDQAETIAPNDDKSIRNAEGEIMSEQIDGSRQSNGSRNEEDGSYGRVSLASNTLSPEAENEETPLSKNNVRIGDHQNSAAEEFLSSFSPMPSETEKITGNSTANIKTSGPLSDETHTQIPEITDSFEQVTIQLKDTVALVTEVANAEVDTDIPIPYVIDDYPESTDNMDIQTTEETIDSGMSAFVETTEVSLSAIRENTTDAQDTRINHVTELPASVMGSVTFMPISEETTVADMLTEETTVADLLTKEITETTEEIVASTIPFTEVVINTVLPDTEENTVSTSVTEEDTNISTRVTDEYSNSIIPVTEGITETVVQFTEDITENVLFGSEEIMETVSPVTTKTIEPEYFVDLETVTYENKEIAGYTETVEPITEETATDKHDNGSVTEYFEHSTAEGNSRAVNITAVADVVLEASPRLEVSQTTGEGPLEPTSFDVKIKTIKDLQVDVHDAIFDPSQIAKATSYEESSYSTATRSATVTTWVDPNIKHFINQGYGNLTNLKEITLNPQGNSDDIQMLPSHVNESADKDISGRLPVTDVTNHSRDQPETSTLNVVKGRESELKVNMHESETMTMNPGSVEHESPQVPIFKLNSGEYETVNGTRVYVTDRNKTENQFIYEMPDVNRSSGTHLTPSVVIALSVCCSVIVLIGILTVSLWFCRRHKNRSKIYLSREAARPRAFFTKPMNPALLPNERHDATDAMYVMEFQKPRAPVVLSDDPDCVVIDGQPVLKTDTQEYAQGIDNHSFVDIPLEELKRYPKNTKNCGRNPPKIGSKCQHEGDADSGIRVWSSTGSLYTVSPELSHCSVPPPPYTSSVGKESVNLSEAMAALGSKARLLYV